MVTHSQDEEGRPDLPEQTQAGSPTQPLSHGQSLPNDVQQELLRQREELAALHTQLDTRGRRQRRVTVLRQVVAAVLVVIAALGVTLSVVGVWAGRTTLNTDRWVQTVAPLDESPAVRAAVSTYLTDQIFQSLNVDERVKEALPPRAAFLAAPLSGQVHGYVKSSVNAVLASEQFAQLWPEMNRIAHRQVMAILDNNSQVVRSSGDTVTLNLLPVVNEVLGRLEKQAPTIFGKSLNLPTLTNGQIPAGLETRIDNALGVKLPSNFAAIPIYRGDELSTAQQAVVKAKQYVGLLVAGSVLALVLALFISPTRRRTTLQFGVWLVVAVVTLTSVIRAIRTELIGQVPSGVLREGVDAAVQIVFVTLRERGTQLLWLGLVIAVVAYLVGPGRGPVALRRGTAEAARFVGQHARRYTAVVVAEGPGFARAYRDPLRIGGAVAAGVLVLFFSSWTSLFVIAVLLGLYELLVTAVAGAAHEETGGSERTPAREATQTRGGTVSTA